MSDFGSEMDGAMERLNEMPQEQFETQMRSCCGSSEWVRRMTAHRPFRDLPQLLDTAAEVWAALGPTDWMEAFLTHPRIGERKAQTDPGAQSKRWSEQEQAGVTRAQAETLAELARLNAAYEARFGHIFLVCATGKSADEMLSIARERLGNDPERELQIAAEEQRKITEIRLRKLVEQTR